MSLFTMPDGSAGISSVDPSAIYSDVGGSSPTYDTYGLGNGYGFSTTPDAAPLGSAQTTLGGLQSSGGSNVDWTAILTGGMGALVAADSISHGLTAQGGVPSYMAPNGVAYPLGMGPANYSSGSSGIGLLLILGLVGFMLAEHKS